MEVLTEVVMGGNVQLINTERSAIIFTRHVGRENISNSTLFSIISTSI